MILKNTSFKMIFKITSLIILVIGSLLSFAPTEIMADGLGSIESSNPVSPNKAVNQIIQASSEASAQRSTDTSNFTSAFNQTNLPKDNSTSLINSLTSPLVIKTTSDTPYTDYKDGEPDSTNRTFLRADVTYLVRSYKNDTGAAMSTTITAHNVYDKNLVQGNIINFKIYDKPTDSIENDKLGYAAALGRSASNSAGDKITVSGDKGSKAATLKLTKGVDSGPNSLGTSATKVSATIGNANGVGSTICAITMRVAYVIPSNTSPKVFNNTKINFWLDESLVKRIIADTIRYAGDGNTASYTPDVTITWHAWSKSMNSDDGANDSTKSTIVSTKNTANVADLDLNKEALKFEYTFFRDLQNIDESGPIYVYADISMNYMTKDTSIWPFPNNSKPAVYHTIIDNYAVSAATGATSQDEVPKVSMSNTVNNMTVSTNDGTTNVANDTVNHTAAADNIKFTSNIVDEFERNSSGVIAEGVYKTEIPRGMKVSDVSLKSANNATTANPPIPKEDDIKVEDDPNNKDKSILTITGIYLPEKASSTTTTKYTLTFNGKVPTDYDHSISFTPTFNGDGGSDDDGNLLPIDEASGTLNYINFDKSDTGVIELLPHNIDFGTINSLIGEDTIKHRVTPDDNSNVLDVTDNRSEKKATKLEIEADSLKSGNTVFPGELTYYDKDGKGRPLAKNDPIVIANTVTGEPLSSIKWSENEGLLLNLKRSSAIPKGTYSTTVTWTATDSVQ